MTKESLIEKLQAARSGKMIRTWEYFDKGIDKAIEIVRQHEAHQPPEDVVERVARVIFTADFSCPQNGISYELAEKIAKAASSAMNELKL